jgi:hypothetical protein
MESKSSSELGTWKDYIRPLTSRRLQDDLPEMYKEFFHTHDMVMSGNGIITWWPDISHGVSALRIKQKLPLKTFCGLNFNNSGKITFRTLFVYDIREDHFKKKNFQEVFRQDIDPLIILLEDFLAKNNFSKWVEFDFLSEAPPWHWFTFSSVFSVLLAVISHLLIGHLSPDSFDERQLMSDDPIFEKIYLFSLDISRTISASDTVGWWSNYAVMVSDTISPIVYFSRSLRSSPWGGIDILSKQAIEETLYKAPIFDFFSLPAPLEWAFPLDYGILFMGREYRFDEIESNREENSKREGILDSFISHTIYNLGIDEEKRQDLRELISSDMDEILHTTIDSINLRILYGFRSLFTENNSASIDAFIEMFGQVGLSSFSYQKENIILSDILHYFHKFREFSDEKIAIIPFNTGKIWGSFLFVMKKWYSPKTLEKTLSKLNMSWYSISLYHGSWRDGYASDGIRLEQYISEGVYSHYTKKWDVCYRDSHGVSYCSDYDAILARETHSILLDTIAGRVYIKWNKLTSADIHSQNTTIDMLRILISNIGQEVSNAKLPISTYSQNKNEILGKIVLPLRKIVEKYFEKEISLTCSGGITEYYLRLEKDETIPIGIIEKF